MGTDMYLSWKGMTKKDKDKRITGWSIGAGQVGYLRASIGMALENRILRFIFPDNWKGKEKQYDFLNKNNLIKLHKSIWFYLIANMTGKDKIIEQNLIPNEQEQLGQKVIDMVKNMGFDKVVVSGENDNPFENVRFAVMWANSLYSFYELGMEKQSKKKKPTIYISW